MQWLAYGLVCLLAIGAEAYRWSDPVERQASLTGWLAGHHADWLPFLPLLAIAPIAAGLRASRRLQTESPLEHWLQQSAASQPRSSAAVVATILIGVFAFGISRWVGQPYADLPPAYHDEFSYLFQAESYLHGRLWFPSFSQRPELFDQMHVLNEGRFASRYFPGVGLWMAPFVDMGDPHLGQQLAQAIAAILVFRCGRELSANGVGLLAAVLFCLSPGMLLFSNLLLSHQPTLVGLLLFLWAFLKWLRCGGLRLLLLAGCGLTFAMLCRPMTAAGFALPFGILFASWWLTGRPVLHPNSTPLPFVPSLATRSLSALMLALPLCVGFAIMLFTQREITGSLLLSPYQQFTDIYTPRHRFGFNNVIIGEQHLGPKVLDNYDLWAENLTPSLAARNVLTRLTASWEWTLGIVPLALGCLVTLFTPQLGGRRWLLIWASIASLHAVHVPYWFSGIMGWHYVLETAPLWLLLFAEGTHRLNLTWNIRGAFGLRLWWRALIVVALMVNLLTVRPLWPGRLPMGFEESAFSRRLYAQFRQSIEELRNGQQAIVFVIPSPSDRHIDYITNPPTLTGPVLVARLNSRDELPAAAALFPNRTVLLYDAANKKWEHF